MRPLWNFLKWRMGLIREDESHPHFEVPPYKPAYAKPDLEKIHHPDPTRAQITWIGHATFLIQLSGMNILTDPIWSERASPVGWAGPKRVAHPGIAFTDLPKIDLVLISHTHYDHLDRPTVRSFESDVKFVVAERTKWWFEREGIMNVSELHWWDRKVVNRIRVSSVPAKHWSKRGVFRTNDAGWCGYVIESPAGIIYFAGDTGYHPTYFKEIAVRFPHIDLALIPIGAYLPRWFMKQYHVNPPEAVQIHKEVRARKSIGMHWGTIPLTSEAIGEPPIYLAKALEEALLPPNDFTVMKIGETRMV